MKMKLLISVPVILVVGYFLILGILIFRAKSKYDAFASEHSTPEIVELTPETEVDLFEEMSAMESREEIEKEVQKKRIVYEELGLSNDTRGFVDLATLDPPPFDLFDMDKNKLNAQKKILQQILSPMLNAHGEIFVKRDRGEITHAFVRILNGEILEIKNRESGGFVEILHCTPDNPEEVEQMKG